MKTHDKVLKKEQKGRERILFENTAGHTETFCKLWKNYNKWDRNTPTSQTLEKVWFKLYANINLSMLGNFDHLARSGFILLKFNLNHYTNGLLMYEI